MSAPDWIVPGADIVLYHGWGPPSQDFELHNGTVDKLAAKSFTVTLARRTLRVYSDTMLSVKRDSGAWGGSFSYTAAHPASGVVSLIRRHLRVKSADAAARDAASRIDRRGRYSNSEMDAHAIRAAAADIMRFADIMAEEIPTGEPVLGWGYTNRQFDQFHRAWTSEPYGPDGRTLCGKRNLDQVTTGKGIPSDGANLRAISCPDCNALVPLVCPEDRWLLPDLDAL